MTVSYKITSKVKPIAQAGLFAKGVVYCLLGALVFMAASHIGGHSVKEADKNGVLNFIEKQPGGDIMVGIIALGLVCYCVWRAIQTFADTEHKGNGKKGIAARIRYAASGLIYASFALYAFKMLFSHAGSSDTKQNIAQDLLSQPAGQWLAAAVSAIFAVVGFYQVYYALSEKYKKHTDKAGNEKSKNALLTAGKIGYVARGIVWLLIAWLFLKAALDSNAARAGDSSKAFGFLASAAYGSYLLGAMAIGLICYGTFNFVRMLYEKFD